MRYPAAMSVAVAAALLLGGCAPPGDVVVRLGPHVDRPEPCVVVFFADGMDPGRVETLVAAGRLPNIQATFYDGGVTFAHGVDSLPSVTYANCSTLITGLHPGHHGITGNLWLDRDTLESRYYMTYGTYRTVNDHLKVPTVYRILRDHFTVNIQGHTRDGVSCSWDNSEMFGWAWFWGDYTLADEHVPDSFREVSKLANRTGRWPSLIMTYYPGVDEVGHWHGTESPAYDAALLNIDRVVGRVTRGLADAGLADRTLYAIVSDHGMPPVEPSRCMDLKRWLARERGFKIYDQPIDAVDYPQRFARLEPYDAFLVIGADRQAAIHLKGRRGWAVMPDRDEVEAFIFAEPALHGLTAVDCVLYRAGGDAVQVVSARGSARIERRGLGQSAEYCIAEQTGDPLGYMADPAVAAFVAAGWHPSRAWLEATAACERPDFVPQAVAMFDSRRIGDVVLFAAERANFTQRYLGGHGSCLRGDMRIMLGFSGPDLPRGVRLGPARLVDFTPTLVGLLGEADRLAQYPDLDGVDLSDALRQARPIAIR